MEKLLDRFVYFSLQKDGKVLFDKNNDNSAEFISPRHPETNDLDLYYLQSMLKYYDSSKEAAENEILDAFPVISLTKDRDSKFYNLSIYRLREFYKGQVEEDDYIQASMKHIFMYSQLAKPSNKTLQRVIAGCMGKVSPVMYHRDERDTVDYEIYQLNSFASYVPTKTYRIMKLLKGWIEGALHFYDYSIMFFDCRFVGFDDFSENIIDLKTKDLFVRGYAGHYKYDIPIYAPNQVILEESKLYYEIKLHIDNILKKWFFTSPNNDNERDGKLMMFRNNDLKVRLEEILSRLLWKTNFRLNDVFKWNRYIKGGEFKSHYDTMFVNKTSEECSLYTLLVYLEVKGDSFMYLYGDKELKIRLESNKAYIIPHWVRHRVEGENLREFIKTEVVFKNKYVGAAYDQTLADAFDASCYYMLQSVRHPELKDIVSQNFNTINEARFYKAVYVPKLKNNIFFVKTILRLPFEYYHKMDGSLIKTSDVKFNFVTDGIYYYFKAKSEIIEAKRLGISRNDAITMMSLMQLDTHPKKIFQRDVRECQCSCRCTDYYDKIQDFDLNEEIVYWDTDAAVQRIADALQYTEFPADMGRVHRVGNISVCDITKKDNVFYFAACQNSYPSIQYKQSLVTEITSLGGDGNYKSLNVEFIGHQKNIIKIRQHSFENGITITRKWIT